MIFFLESVIAEIGIDYVRDLDIALRLIDVVAEAGADPVKFQIIP